MLIWVVRAWHQKFLVPKIGSCGTFRTSRPTEGVAHVTDAERDAVDADGAKDEGP
jgi:hypothetical protein